MEPSCLTGGQKTVRLLDSCRQRGGMVLWLRSPEIQDGGGGAESWSSGGEAWDWRFVDVDSW